MAKIKVFRYVCQRSGSRSLGQKLWHDQKCFITRNVYMKYEGLPFIVQKLWPRLKFLERSKALSRSPSHEP